MTQSRTTSFLNPQVLQWLAILVALLALGAFGSQDDCSVTGESCFNLLQFTLNGILVGGVYALVALGIVIINKASGIFNFAHGLIMLFSGLMFWENFRAIPSQNLSLLLSAGTAIIILTFFSGHPSPASGKETLQQRLQRLFGRQQFLIALGVAIAAAVATFLVLQNLEDNILRGAFGGLIASILVGLAIERFAIRPLLGQPVLAAIMMTLAVGLVLQGMSTLVWGTQPKSIPVFVEKTEQQVQRIPIGQDPETGETIYQVIENPGASTVSGRSLPNYKLATADLLGEDLSFARNLVWGFGAALLCFTAFIVFFQYTSTGLAMRAVAEDQTLAESVGLRVRVILAVAWAIAAVMAMVAAVIQGTGAGTGLSFLVISPLAFRAFPAVLLGGLESITGALVGGLIIGVVEVLGGVLIGSESGQEFAPWAVLLIVLLIRPDGLFGQRRIDRV